MNWFLNFVTLVLFLPSVLMLFSNPNNNPKWTVLGIFLSSVWMLFVLLVCYAGVKLVT